MRREDRRFITGQGRYGDDLRLDRTAHAVVLRSPHAHAVIRSIEVPAPLPNGILAVLTGEDWTGPALPGIPADGPLRRGDGPPPATPRYPLAKGRARMVGEPVALVVAESRAAAQEAAEALEVTYDPLPAVASIEDAILPGAPASWEGAPDNIAFTWHKGDEPALAAAIHAAAHVARAELDISRVAAAPIEPRVATGAVEDGRLALRTSHQSPYGLRDALAKLFAVEKAGVRVIAGDVGGSFGMKAGVPREDVLVLWAARLLGRPVRWTSSRAEAFLSDAQARDAKATTELALDADGKFLAFRLRYDVNIGAYLEQRSLAPINNIGGIAGVYRIPRIGASVRGILTNTLQTAPYRGAGRPEATYVLERTIDIAARELGIDPFELRRRNLIPPDAMPYATGFVFTYDCGDFAANMDEAAGLIDLPNFPARRSASVQRGKLRGLGISNPIEVAGGPHGRPNKDLSRLTLSADGRLLLETGAMSVGQGLETALTQLAAERLSVVADQIDYLQGDTDQLPSGRGSGGSSAIAVGGAAVKLALDAFIDEARRAAADEFEASAEDVEFTEGRFRIAGTDRSLTLAELAEARAASGAIPISGEAAFQPEATTFPNGCHICEVEIDPDTGAVELLDYVAVEDIGRVLNPVLVEGQMHGGVAQGAGQALKERIVYDAAGELLSGSFQDYAMPHAEDLPWIRTASLEVPTKVNPLGAKGVGEAGTVGSIAAVMNAVCDALAGHGIRHLDMPASPERVWRALKGAAGRTSSGQ